MAQFEALCAPSEDGPGYLCNHLGVASQLAEEGDPNAQAGRPGTRKPKIERLCSGETPSVDQVFSEFLKRGESSRRWFVTEDAGAGKSIFTHRLQAWLGEVDSRGSRPLGRTPLV
ncbi:MAG: hypothetical protein ACKOJF_33530, partial [Planctomycetaceae bacterium]